MSAESFDKALNDYHAETERLRAGVEFDTLIQACEFAATLDRQRDWPTLEIDNRGERPTVKLLPVGVHVATSDDVWATFDNGPHPTLEFGKREGSDTRSRYHEPAEIITGHYLMHELFAITYDDTRGIRERVTYEPVVVRVQDCTECPEHEGHRAHFTGAWYCDTCDSPLCNRADECDHDDIVGWALIYRYEGE